ncbi:MAG: molybdopterin-guanine dinucleotide biosynthesis protein B [Lachnospiraceae bacterium]|nr:molybdopterin-guanine dinucleotide biosynthesis protein B [Lachnospiraceae bacterium]
MKLETLALLLCGGNGRRMGGRQKSKLKTGGTSFAQRIGTELLKVADRLLLSCREAGQAPQFAGLPCELLFDRTPGIGPIGGLFTALDSMKGGLLITAPCDMPGLKADLYTYLTRKLTATESTASPEAVPVAAIPTYGEKCYPLSALYRKTALPYIKSSIEKGDYGIQYALKDAPVLYVDVSSLHGAGRMLFNINTEEDYREFRALEKIVAVCGLKNTGKTTLLRDLIKELSKRGINTAVVKHDAHGFDCDIPSTDSYILQRAGAGGTAVFSKDHYFINNYDEFLQDKAREKQVLFLAGHFDKADLIFVEGMKDSTFPKIEILRSGLSQKSVSNPEGLFLIVTDIPEYLENSHCTVGGRQIPVLSYRDKEQILEALSRQMGSQLLETPS